MNEIEEKKNRLDHALAQLVVHASSKERDLGVEASLEELAALSEGKLSKARRNQILAQFETNQALYETWLEIDPIESDTANMTSAVTEQKPSLLQAITAWFETLFSWQGAMTATMGAFVGAVAILISDATIQEYPDTPSNQLAISTPLSSPQKANQAVAHAPMSDKFKCYSAQTVIGEEFCVSNTRNVQHWIYSDKQNALIAVPSPFDAGQLLDIKIAGDKIAIVSENNQSGVDLAIVEYQLTKDSIAYKTLYRYIERNADTSDKRSVGSAIEIQSMDERSITFQILRKDGQLVSEKYEF